MIIEGGITVKKSPLNKPSPIVRNITPASAIKRKNILFPQNTNLIIPSNGLKIWLKGDAGVSYDSSGFGVNIWEDQSGRGNHATYVSGNTNEEGESTPKPTYMFYGINNQPSISFSGGSWLRINENSIGNNGNLTVFVVINRTAGGIILNKGDGATYGGTVWELAPQNGYGYVGGTEEDGFSWNTIPVTFSGLRVIRAITDNGISKIFYNGIDSGNTSTQAVGFNNIQQYIGIGGGGTNGGSQVPLQAIISEIIVYDRALSNAECAVVETYLNSKYLYSLSNMFLPKMWLKADAGVTKASSTFVSQIVFTDAGESSSNGTYTRVSGGTTTFNGPNGNYIEWDGSQWLVYDNNWNGGDYTYYNDSPELDEGNWGEYNASNAPIATNTTSNGPEVVTAWADQSGNSNHFAGGTATQINNYINGKPAIFFNGTSNYLTGPSTLLDNFSEITVIGVWKIKAGANQGVFGTSDYRDISIISHGSPHNGPVVRIRNDDYDAQFIEGQSLFDADVWSISAILASNQNGQAYKNGALLDGTNSSAVELPTRSGITYELGRYAYPEYSNLYAEMHLAEFLIYDRKISDLERQQIETYLNNKYAIY